MGIRDRDYYKSPPSRGGFGAFHFWSVTTWLIMANIVAMFIVAAFRRGTLHDVPWLGDDASLRAFRMAMMTPVERWGYFSTDTAIYHGQIWRFVTFQFLHASGIHLVLNMVSLFFFGPIVESVIGGRRFLAFYLTCGMAGAACYLLLSWLSVLGASAATPLVGASAGVFGLLVAAAIISPEVEIFYYIIPITIRMVAILGMLMAAYSIVSLGYNAGGEAAHFGGGVAGFLLFHNQHWLNLVLPTRRQSMAMVSAGGGRPLTQGRSGNTRRRRRRWLQKDWTKDMNR